MKALFYQVQVRHLAIQSSIMGTQNSKDSPGGGFSSSSSTEPKVAEMPVGEMVHPNSNKFLSKFPIRHAHEPRL